MNEGDDGEILRELQGYQELLRKMKSSGLLEPEELEVLKQAGLI